MAPFFVIGTPRSRTAWLAEVLSTAARKCVHEPSRRWRSIEEFARSVSAPGAAMSDSMLTLRWRDIVSLRPDARFVFIERPAEDVEHSFIDLGMWNPTLRPLIDRIVACGRECVAEGYGLRVDYGLLGRVEAVERIFRHLHRLSPPEGWVASWQPRKVVSDPVAAVADVLANLDGVRAVYPEVMEIAA